MGTEGISLLDGEAQGNQDSGLTYICVCVFMFVYVYTFMFIYMYVWWWMDGWVHRQGGNLAPRWRGAGSSGFGADLYIYMCVYVYICVCIYVFVCVYTHAFMYVCGGWVGGWV